MKFSQRLKKLRQEKGISQMALANAINIPQTTISDWESGKSEPSISAARAIAKYFGVSLDLF